MAEDAIRNLLLSVGIDQAKLRDALRGLESMRASFQTLGGEVAAQSRTIKDLDAATGALRRQDAILSLVRQYQQLGKETGNANLALAELRANMNDIGSNAAEIERATKAFQQMEAASSGATQKGGGKFNAGSLLRNASQALPGGAGDALRAADDIAGVTESLGALGTVGAVAAPAVAAVAAAVVIFTASNKEASASLASAVKAQREYAKLVVEGNSLLAKKQIEGLQKELQGLQIARDNAQAIMDQDFAEDQTRTLGDVGARVRTLVKGLTDTDFQGANKEIADLDAQIRNTQTQIDLFTQGLRENAFAANDAAAAAKAASAQSQASAIRGVDDVLDRFQRRNELEQRFKDSMGLTVEAIKERLAKGREEIYLVQTSIRQLNDELLVARLNGAETKALEEKIAELTARLQELREETEQDANEILKVIVARKTEEAVAKLQTKAFQEAAAASKELVSLEKNRKTLLEDRKRDDERAAAIGDLQARIDAAKEQERLADNQSKRDKLFDKHAQDEMDAQAELYKDLTGIQDDYAENVRRVLRDSGRDLLSATASRDVAAFTEAKRRRDDQLGDLRDNLTKETRERVDSFVQQRAEAQRAYQQQLADLQTAAQQRVSLSARLEKELSDLKARYAQEDQKRQRAIEDAGYRERVALLTAQVKAITPLLKRPLEIVRDLGIAVVQDLIKTSAVAKTIFSGISIVSSLLSKFRVPGLTSNAEGGIYANRPTLSVLGDKPGFSEVVLPIRQSEGIVPALQRVMGQAGGRGGGPIYLSVNVDKEVDVITVDQFNRAIGNLIAGFSQATQMGPVIGGAS